MLVVFLCGHGAAQQPQRKRKETPLRQATIISACCLRLFFCSLQRIKFIRIIWLFEDDDADDLRKCANGVASEDRVRDRSMRFVLLGLTRYSWMLKASSSEWDVLSSQEPVIIKAEEIARVSYE